MKDKERDSLDDLFRSKLYDLEADTSPEDWESIAGRLPDVERRPIFLRHTFRYWAAAAVLALLISLGGIYLNKEMENEAVSLLAQEEKVMDEPESGSEEISIVDHEGEDTTEKDNLLPERVIVSSRGRAVRPLLAVVSDIRPTEIELPQEDLDLEIERPQERTVSKKKSRVATVVPDDQAGAYYAERSPVPSTQGYKSHDSKKQKWQVGLSSGSLSFKSENSVNRYVTNSDALRSESLLAMNAVSNSNSIDSKKTNIHHRIPFNVGLSAEYYLMPRLSLQFGVSYAYLVSDWKTNGVYHTKEERRLHFVGIPVSLSYTIAEWNKVRFYASAGAKAEVNVAGRQKMRLFSDDNVIALEEEKVRMKEWQWSVNAGLGASYPLVRFMNLFAEVGGAYYFDNGSAIETIYAEKPFNLNLQVGLRFGF